MLLIINRSFIQKEPLENAICTRLYWLLENNEGKKNYHYLPQPPELYPHVTKQIKISLQLCHPEQVQSHLISEAK